MEFTALAVDAVDGPVPVYCDPESGSRFPVGGVMPVPVDVVGLQ